MEAGAGTSAGRPPFLLVGLSILLTAALVFILLVPVAPCRDCLGRRIRLAYEEQLRIEEKLAPSTQANPRPCERCRDRTRITLFNKWFGRPSVSY
jgi:hypothetical protein